MPKACPYIPLAIFDGKTLLGEGIAEHCYERGGEAAEVYRAVADGEGESGRGRRLERVEKVAVEHLTDFQEAKQADVARVEDIVERRAAAAHGPREIGIGPMPAVNLRPNHRANVNLAYRPLLHHAKVSENRHQINQKFHAEIEFISFTFGEILIVDFFFTFIMSIPPQTFPSIFSDMAAIIVEVI